ncbi:MAG: methyl-accepting chemotaxis protein [Ruminococcus sp.]|jgi:methyl-accepting chemotaxis protein|nr:methyl-accepting chemotaxis protein [Ruminococcus sp.]
MKNLKISRKLLVGFGVPVFLTVVIMLLVLFTNIQSIKNIGLVGEQTDLWNYAQTVKTHFASARVSALGVYYNYTDDSYDKTVTSLEESEKAINATIKYIEETPALAQFKTDADSAAESIKTYTEELQTMVDALLNAQTSYDEAVATGGELTDNLGAILGRAVELTSNDFSVIQSGGTADVAHRITNLTSATEVNDAIAQARVLVRGALSGYTTEAGEQALEAVATAQTAIDNYYASINDAQNRASIEIVQEALANYGASLNDYIESQGVITASAAAFSAAAAEAEGYIDTLQDQNETVNGSVAETSNLATFALIIVVGIVIASLIITIIVAGKVTRSIADPISYVTHILNQLSTRGKTTYTEAEYKKLREFAQSKDEAGECAVNLERMMEALNGVAGLLSTIAAGNLNITHKEMSEDDVISKSIINMLDNLNTMFGEIDMASDQVTIGASQISDASQSLAEGSTEQAATVEELSASIHDVAEKTQLNAVRATDASKLSGAIKDKAVTGSQQMSEMTAAVNEINAASQDISKVIKVIDDIAFQTNILALNAAVEAARAGEAGKGFAVVADEVRNLASKSAAAAKETGQLIENAMRKSEQGADIASQTAVSLSEIVDGINKSAALIGEIASSSEEQSYAINQINVAIEQVSEVVQKNSATAEECAASAEELNAQSSILADHVAQFTLR